ncbi:hypothetical protein N7478_007539 [Penicillium angulare]|uniref:uncharacterized protein n=1 Tax=Penicillium angulare TaxID=116970 RepID=UPI0025411275|nr:uncharacterized protein N7478_007539 [Penicillium angulare]KAJ5272414.1 hypothetical protein N7478_007539 [Penicillium angulare]
MYVSSTQTPFKLTTDPLYSQAPRFTVASSPDTRHHVAWQHTLQPTIESTQQYTQKVTTFSSFERLESPSEYYKFERTE